MKLSLAIFAVLLLTACHDAAWFDYETAPPPSVALVADGSIQVTEGTAVVIVPYFVHEEVEGSSRHAADEVRSRDTTIASATTSTHIYELEPGTNTRGVTIVGQRVGTTFLELLRRGDVDGTIAIHVLPATP